MWEMVHARPGPNGPLTPPPPAGPSPLCQCQSELGGRHSWNSRAGQEEGQGGLPRPRHAGAPGTRELGLPWRSPERQGGVGVAVLFRVAGVDVALGGWQVGI